MGLPVGVGGGSGVLEDARNASRVILIQELGGQSVAQCRETAGSKAYLAHMSIKAIASHVNTEPRGPRAERILWKYRMAGIMKMSSVLPLGVD